MRDTPMLNTDRRVSLVRTQKPSQEKENREKRKGSESDYP